MILRNGARILCRRGRLPKLDDVGCGAMSSCAALTWVGRAQSCVKCADSESLKVCNFMPCLAGNWGFVLSTDFITQHNGGYVELIEGMTTQEVAIRRLQQTRNHLKRTRSSSSKRLSIVHGPTEPALVDWTLANLLDEQCKIAGDRQCLIVPFSDTTWTFSELRQRARNLAKGLLALGLRRGDRIGILAGNCEEYATVFYSCGYIGAILVVLNSTYTAAEAKYALNHSGESSDQYLQPQS